MKKIQCIIVLTAFVISIGFLEATAQVTSSSKITKQPVILNIKPNKSRINEIRFTLELRNNGPRAIYYAVNPQDIDGKSGPYISTSEDDSSIIELQWRLFEPDVLTAVESYSSKTGIELKRLSSGQTAIDTLSVKWPLSQTVPPLRVRNKRIERGPIKRLRFNVGYFPESNSLQDFLTGKRFGWFVTGLEPITSGDHQGKRLYQLQEVTSIEIPIPGTEE